MPYTRESWQFDYKDAKFDLVNQPITNRESVDVRARGASKTFDAMEDIMYLAYIGYKCIWFSSGKSQLEQPTEYMAYIIDRSALIRNSLVKKKILTQSIVFKNGGQLKLRNLTELNARSSRADAIVYDEEAQADESAYNAAVSILAGSNLGLVFHISTAAKATIFEVNHDRIKLRGEKFNTKNIFYRKWYEVGFLLTKKEWYEEEKRIKPGWYFRQEHECSFELPSGAVFKNVDYSPYSDAEKVLIYNQQLCSGVDWNPVAGHWLTAVKWDPNMKAVYIQEVHPLGNGYTHEMTNKQYNIIRPYYMRGNALTVEEGGINEAYCNWLREQESLNSWSGNRQLNFEEWDSSGVNKLDACEFLIQNGICIRIDKARFPVLSKMVEECHWDTDATEPKLAKNPADSPHALDSFLHAISELNRMDNYIELGRFY